MHLCSVAIPNSMKWITYGRPKGSIDEYKFNFYENKTGEFFLVVWRKPRFRRVIALGKHLHSNLVADLVDADIPRTVAAFLAEDTFRLLKRWI